MEVWSGTVAGTAAPSQGFSLIDPLSTGHCDIPKDAKLSLRSFVNPALVPYYARTGPALECHISESELAEWWKARLLCSICWDDDADELDESQPVQQCPTGLLLAVETRAAPNGCRNNVTDILIYGVLSLHSLKPNRPPTPPPSSSPSFRDLDPGNGNIISAPERELRIYAVTLCSALIEKAESLPSRPLSPEPASLNDTDHEPFAEFLPELRSPSPKRKRMANLFEAATEYHKKVRRKGGEAVAQLMSGSSSSSQFSSNPSFTRIKKEPDLNTIDAPGNTHRPRTLSISRITRVPKQPSPAPAAHTRAVNAGPRPLSVSSRRSTPAPPLKEQQQQEPQLSSSQKSMSSASPSEIIATNKALLTRTILTCMRLYGYHRNSRTGATSQLKRTPTVPDPDIDSPVIPTVTMESQSRPHSRPSTATTVSAVAAVPETDEDEDFKAMYHATYRAASFALRRYLKDAPGAGGDFVPVLERGKATDLVDNVLKLFCEAV
ncbi:hypothetical protein AJ79_07557 [Helicocarpus griseus UAMH5409]|uniref:Sld7 C-terminal domain-containing protein n=1 Tax=Helicocarpus griseus UAMH5409 TaxID=1447875 RepID=A0A2B7X1V6_9EURO|nr:hypothetical protein AJ79_07557 [Helicocarpus griseus UAMH5409]